MDYSQKDRPVKMPANVVEKLLAATHVIVAPGNTHGSVLPALCTPGLKELVKDKQLVYILPFFNRSDLRQTQGWKAFDYVQVYNRYLSRQPNIVILNNCYDQQIENHEWVIDNLSEHAAELKEIKCISQNLCSQERLQQ